jgi:hypothetical protein
MSEPSLSPSPLPPHDSATGRAVASLDALPTDRRWIHRIAIAAAAVATLVLVAFVARYLRPDASLGGSSEAPPIAGMILSGTIALMALEAAILRPERGARRQVVLTSVAWSLTLLVALFMTWGVIATVNPRNQWHGVHMQDAAEVDAYLGRHVPSDMTRTIIPTGILVKSLEFLNGDNVQVTGYIWQKFGPGIPDTLVRGAILAESVKDTYKQIEAYRYEEGGVETVGWYFETTLRQPFEYAEYPFDEQDVWFRLWAKDFSRDTILVPDFDSYASLDPASLPGLEKEFVYTGWTPISSGFTLSNQPYSTSFGIGKANAYVELPELYFNLVLDRNFGGPFFEHIVFALAVTILLFGLLLLTTDSEDLKSRFQLSTAGVLGTASGLLFAVILKHNQLRSVVGAEGVSYIETIPIMLYGVIVFVVVNAILLASPYDGRLIHRQGNLLPILAYWPVVLGLVLAVTLVVFFHA